MFVKACGDHLVALNSLRKGIRSTELEKCQEKLDIVGVPITSRLITRAFNAETSVPMVDKNVDGSSGYLFTTLDTMNLTPTEHQIYDGIIHLLKRSSLYRLLFVCGVYICCSRILINSLSLRPWCKVISDKVALKFVPLPVTF